MTTALAQSHGERVSLSVIKDAETLAKRPKTDGTHYERGRQGGRAAVDRRGRVGRNLFKRDCCASVPVRSILLDGPIVRRSSLRPAVRSGRGAGDGGDGNDRKAVVPSRYQIRADG